MTVATDRPVPPRSNSSTTPRIAKAITLGRTTAVTRDALLRTSSVNSARPRAARRSMAVSRVGVAV